MKLRVWTSCDDEATRPATRSRGAFAIFVVGACMMQACAPPAVVVSETELTSARAPAAAAPEPEASATNEPLVSPRRSSSRLDADLGLEPGAAPKSADGFEPFRPSSDRRASTFGLWK